MSDSLDAPNPSEVPSNPNASSAENPPPFIQIIKIPNSCQVSHNLIDPWLALALLEMGKQALLDGMKPTVLQPGGNGMAGLMAKMRRN